MYNEVVSSLLTQKPTEDQQNISGKPSKQPQQNPILDEMSNAYYDQYEYIANAHNNATQYLNEMRSLLKNSGLSDEVIEMNPLIEDLKHKTLNLGMKVKQYFPMQETLKSLGYFELDKLVKSDSILSSFLDGSVGTVVGGLVKNFDLKKAKELKKIPKIVIIKFKTKVKDLKGKVS